MSALAATLILVAAGLGAAVVIVLLVVLLPPQQEERSPFTPETQAMLDEYWHERQALEAERRALVAERLRQERQPGYWIECAIGLIVPLWVAFLCVRVMWGS